jgi:hypothetical protein
MDPFTLFASAIQLAKAIVDTVATVKRNRAECKQLGDRVCRLQPMIIALRTNVAGYRHRASISLVAERLVELLETIGDFLLQFSGEAPGTGMRSKVFKLVGKALNASEHAGTFTVLNNRLDSVLIELNCIETSAIAGHICKNESTDGWPIEDSFTEDPPMEGHRDKRSILGAGRFTTTHRMWNKADDCKHAVKRVDLVNAEKNGVTRLMLHSECATLEKLAHAHIARYCMHFYSHKSQYFNIVMELIAGGTLAEKVTCTTAPTEVEIIEWSRQIASALSYMHEKNVLHRDLTPENIVLTAGSMIKIVDVGLTSAAACTGGLQTNMRITTYASFEKVFGAPYDGRDDVWAVGCIVVELAIRARLVHFHCFSSSFATFLPNFTSTVFT